MAPESQGLDPAAADDEDDGELADLMEILNSLPDKAAVGEDDGDESDDDGELAEFAELIENLGDEVEGEEDEEDGDDQEVADFVRFVDFLDVLQSGTLRDKGESGARGDDDDDLAFLDCLDGSEGGDGADDELAVFFDCLDGHDIGLPDKDEELAALLEFFRSPPSDLDHGPSEGALVWLKIVEGMTTEQRWWFMEYLWPEGWDAQEEDPNSWMSCLRGWMGPYFEQQPEADATSTSSGEEADGKKKRIIVAIAPQTVEERASVEEMV